MKKILVLEILEYRIRKKIIVVELPHLIVEGWLVSMNLSKLKHSGNFHMSACQPHNFVLVSS